MARPKLSSRQRTALRHMIQSMARARSSRADILKAVSRKYQISPESVRWYLRPGGTLRGRSGPKPTSSSKNHVPKRTRLLEVIKSVSLQKLRKALEAKRLIPVLQAVLKRRERLVRVEREIKKDLRSTEVRARNLKRRINRLVEV